MVGLCLGRVDAKDISPDDFVYESNGLMNHLFT